MECKISDGDAMKRGRGIDVSRMADGQMSLTFGGKYKFTMSRDAARAIVDSIYTLLRRKR